jgi:hypothetical protein
VKIGNPGGYLADLYQSMFKMINMYEVSLTSR